MIHIPSIVRKHTTDRVNVAMKRFAQQIEVKLRAWLREGMSPWRLALTLALGFSIGLLPFVGIPTVICLGLALVLRLNLPVIQAANLLAWPAQLVALLPLVKLGAWTAMRTVGHEPNWIDGTGAVARFFGPASGYATELALGWLVAVVPLIFVLTMMTRVVLRPIMKTKFA